jgi:hypothetical protein
MRKNNIVFKTFFSLVLISLISFFLMQSKSHSQEKILISEHTLLKLNGYLKGKFFSKRYDNQIANVSGLYFFISKDGQYSAMSFCPDFEVNNCIVNHEDYKTKYLCQKIAGQTCYKIFFKKKFIKNQKKVNDLNSFFVDKHFSKVENIKKKIALLSTENKAITFEEQSSDSGWE